MSPTPTIPKLRRELFIVLVTAFLGDLPYWIKREILLNQNLNQQSEF
jgi:hypothetical protein